MLSIRKTILHSKSLKRFKAMEDDVLFFLIKEKKLQGNYGKIFNELSYRLSNVIEMTSLHFIKDKTEYEMMRRFSPNPDLFHFASTKGMQTSTYLAYEGKSEEAKERILSKIEVLLKDEISKNPFIPCIFDIVHTEMLQILCLRYPDYFKEGDQEAQNYIDALLKGE